MLAVAADIRVASGRAFDTETQVEEWMKQVGDGVAGYVTPKVAVGAVVGDEDGRILLVQRADSGIWLYPTGWCDVGHLSPPRRGAHATGCGGAGRTRPGPARR